MKLSPMIVQALWDKNKKYSLLQLPHITENHLRHFVTKKVLKIKVSWQVINFNFIFK